MRKEQEDVKIKFHSGQWWIESKDGDIRPMTSYEIQVFQLCQD